MSAAILAARHYLESRSIPARTAGKVHDIMPGFGAGMMLVAACRRTWQSHAR